MRTKLSNFGGFADIDPLQLMEIQCIEEERTFSDVGHGYRLPDQGFFVVMRLETKDGLNREAGFP